MYIPSFAAGVIATLLVEFVLVVIFAIWAVIKYSKSYNDNSETENTQN